HRDDADLHARRTRVPARRAPALPPARLTGGPLLLVIDNYDSFTWNLVQLIGELGVEPVVRRNDEIRVEDVAELGPERIVISPGPCTPAEAGISVEVIRRHGESTPILGVCLGHQAIGTAYGGNVVRAR